MTKTNRPPEADLKKKAADWERIRAVYFKRVRNFNRAKNCLRLADAYDKEAADLTIKKLSQKPAHRENAK